MARINLGHFQQKLHNTNARHRAHKVETMGERTSIEADMMQAAHRAHHARRDMKCERKRWISRIVGARTMTMSTIFTTIALQMRFRCAMCCVRAEPKENCEQVSISMISMSSVYFAFVSINLFMCTGLSARMAENKHDGWMGWKPTLWDIEQTK